MKDQLLLIWSDGKKRKFIILAMIAVAVIWIYMSMDSKSDSSTNTDRRFQPREGSVFGVATSASQIGERDSAGVLKELTQTFTERERDLEVREQAIERRFSEQEQTVQNLQGSLFEITKKLDAMSKLSGRELSGDIPGQAGNRNNQAYVQGEQGKVDVVSQDGNIVQRRQTQIITPQQPAIEGRVIRTITQRNVREVHKSGVVEEKAIEVKGLSERTQQVSRTGEAQNQAPENKSVVGDNGGEFTLTMGSIITGVLINGSALPTSSSGQKDPMPILMRVKKEALMPNHFTLDIRECHLLGSGIGDLASSRGYIRAEAISCITEDGQAIEKNITAYAVSSSDGMGGIAGDVVFKSGALLANTMKADFLSNFGKALAPQRVQSLNTTPGATELWQANNLDRAAGAGMASGFGGATERLANYYMQMAESAHPVIELLPGLEVDFIVQRGMTMKLGGESMVGLQE